MRLSPLGGRVLFKSYYVATGLDPVSGRVSEHQLRTRIKKCSLYKNYDVPIIALCWMLIIEYQRVEKCLAMDDRYSAFKLFERKRFKELLGADFVQCYKSMIDVTTKSDKLLQGGVLGGVSQIIPESINTEVSGYSVVSDILEVLETCIQSASPSPFTSAK